MAELSGGVSLAEVQAMMAEVMPKPGSAAPPAVAVDGNAGDVTDYARANHTHESRLQARRIQVTPNANGQYVYTFPKAYNAVIPIVTATAETPAGSTYRHDVSILEGATTATQTTLIITRQSQSITTGLLGAVLAIFAPVTTAVWVNIMSRAPS